MRRVLVQVENEKRVLLPEEEAHHLVRVLRARAGEMFIGFDGTGNLYLCRLARKGAEWFGEIVESVIENRESPLSVTLAQSLIKKDKLELVIQKAVELGVQEIIPVMTARTEIRLRAETEGRKRERRQKILIEAVKQSRRGRIPLLQAPVTLSDLLARNLHSFRFFLDEQGGRDLKSLVQENREAKSCLVLVGPEGGWDDRDRDLFKQHHVPPVHLGPRTLRTETAPLVILSILQYELGDLTSPS